MIAEDFDPGDPIFPHPRPLVFRRLLERARLVGALAASLVVACLPDRASAAKPSIALVLTDDQEVELVEHMPRLRRLVVDQGATFARAYYNDPLCCPSRATILTGKYVQNTGVYANSHALFYDAGDARSTVAVWLHAAGYRTALVGKYLNGYPDPAPESYVPPGWDYWAASVRSGARPYDYRLEENGTVRRYGDAPEDYVTDVLGRQALGFVRRAATDGVPFFLVLAVHAPHVPAAPAPRHAGLFQDLATPRWPSFDEEDVADKPAFVRAMPRLTTEDAARLDETYRQRVRSLQAVDETVEALVDLLRETGRLADTYLVFASDNGWLNGQHRVRHGKGLPYEEVIRMPLYVRGPAVRAGSTLDHLVGNVDLAATFADWAGVPPPADRDGRSFAPLLGPGAPDPDAWRRAYPLRFDASADTEGEGWPDWRGVRTREYTYAEYATGERELYDNAADPYQLRNVAASAAPALLRRLASLTAALASCAGETCRKLEDAPF